MALPMNDDHANRELSIGELEAVAAGLMMRPIPIDPKIPPKFLPALPPRWHVGPAGEIQRLFS